MPIGSKAQAVQTSKGHDDKSVESENLEKRETKTKTTSKALTAALVIRKKKIKILKKRKEKIILKKKNDPKSRGEIAEYADNLFNRLFFHRHTSKS